MSDPDRGLTRRRAIAGLTLAVFGERTVVGASADGSRFAERFATFEPPVPMRPIALLDRHGRAATLTPVAGRIDLIQLWATWCPACRRDLPELAAAQPVLARTGIDAMLVNVDAAPVANVLARATDLSTGSLPQFFDPDGHMLAAPYPDGRRSPLQQFGMPILFVVDRVGLVRGYVKGSIDWSNLDVMAFFRALADAAP